MAIRPHRRRWKPGPDGSPADRRRTLVEMMESRQKLAQELNAQRDAKLAEERRQAELLQEQQAEQIRQQKGYGAW
jgi:DNA-binding MarR family transcriptional regulator